MGITAGHVVGEVKAMLLKKRARGNINTGLALGAQRQSDASDEHLQRLRACVAVMCIASKARSGTTLKLKSEPQVGNWGTCFHSELLTENKGYGNATPVKGRGPVRSVVVNRRSRKGSNLCRVRGNRVLGEQTEGIGSRMPI